MREITKRQLEILTWIDQYTTSHGYAPTLRELAAGNGIVSTNGAHDHLDRLEAKGMLTRSKTKSRTVLLTPEGRYVVREDDGLAEVVMAANNAALESPDDPMAVQMAGWLRELQERRGMAA